MLCGCEYDVVLLYLVRCCFLRPVVTWSYSMYDPIGFPYHNKVVCSSSTPRVAMNTLWQASCRNGVFECGL